MPNTANSQVRQLSSVLLLLLLLLLLVVVEKVRLRRLQNLLLLLLLTEQKMLRRVALQEGGRHSLGGLVALKDSHHRCLLREGRLQRFYDRVHLGDAALKIDQSHKSREE